MFLLPSITFLKILVMINLKYLPFNLLSLLLKKKHSFHDLELTIFVFWLFSEDSIQVSSLSAIEFCPDFEDGEGLSLCESKIKNQDN